MEIDVVMVAVKPRGLALRWRLQAWPTRHVVGGDEQGQRCDGVRPGMPRGGAYPVDLIIGG